MTSKLISSYKNLTMFDFVRKVLHVSARILGLFSFSKIKSFYYFKTTRIKLGRNIVVHGLSFNVHVGDQTQFYDNCVFELGDRSELKIGTNVVLSYGVLLACQEKIVIGNDVQIGEYSSLRDSTHDYKDVSKPMKYAADIATPILIGDNVWIGRGCLIMPGAVIEEGVVVASNSVVGKGKLERNGIYGGTPAKFIKWRTATT